MYFVHQATVGNAVRPPPMECHIELTSMAPVYQLPRILSYYEKVDVDKIVDNLIAQGIVRPSESSYASKIVLVKKKTGDHRMCIDRTINNQYRDNYPLPLIDDCLDYLEGKNYFSIFDFKNGFHQVPTQETFSLANSAHFFFDTLLLACYCPLASYLYVCIIFVLCLLQG